MLLLAIAAADSRTAPSILARPQWAMCMSTALKPRVPTKLVFPKIRNGCCGSGRRRHTERHGMNTRARATRLVGDGDQAVSGTRPDHVRRRWRPHHTLPRQARQVLGAATRRLGETTDRPIDKREQLNNRVAASCMGLFMSDHHREAVDGPV